MALDDSESASRGVDEVMELPACDVKELMKRSRTRQPTKGTAKVGQRQMAHNSAQTSHHCAR